MLQGTTDIQPTASQSSQAHPTVPDLPNDKGIGKRNELPPNASSATLNQIWRAKDKIKSLEIFLQEHPVYI